MKKVLVIGMTSTPGGVESFLINYCLNENMSNIRFDFLSPSEQKIAYADQLEKICEVYYVMPKSKNPLLHKRQLRGFFKEHSKEYVAVWANLNSLMNIDFLNYAKKYGIKRIIVHSHNSNNMGGRIQKIFHTINKCVIGNIGTDFWACASDAAKWFYPNKLSSKVRIIKNAIKVDNFTFDQCKREKLRKEYDLENCKVIGHIGRLHFQKNQSYLLSIMHKLIQNDNSYRLVLIGSGPDYEKLVEETTKLKLDSYVLFVGQQRDIKGWLSAFDIFAFPSRFEGLSIVGLEAQANGLPIVASTNAINDEGLLNTNVKRISLEKNIEDWSKLISQSIKEERINISLVKKNFVENHFDIDSEVEELSDFFGCM